MGLRHKILLITAFLLGASGASAQQWQIVTPRQIMPVPPDGSTLVFPNVNLIAGMKYRVHASGSVIVSASKESADACYYSQGFFQFSPLIVPVSLRVRYDGINENWYYTYYTASGFQKGYQSSHIYDATIPSSGVPLAFRFKDSQYGDNVDSILIDVARETPGIAIEKDTLDFGTVRVGLSKMLPDSIESYGIEGYKVDSYTVLGPLAAKFKVISRIPPFTLTEATNEFLITYSPTGGGRDSAELHIFSSNGFGADKEKIIYLYGNGFNTKLAFTTDTLDFGVLRTGKTKTLPDSIINLNNLQVTITAITPETPGSAYSVTGGLAPIAAGSRTPLSVTFSPIKDGTYFEKFDVTTDDGSVFHFYATGIAGVPVAQLQKDILDFGKVILKQSKTLPDDFGNAPLPIGTAPLNVVSTFNSNPAEYLIGGNTGVKSYEPGHSETYQITFTPQVHIPLCANHDGYFTLTFDDGTSKTITFKGCDHSPLDVKLTIDSMYYVGAGEELDVTQRLLDIEDPLDSALTPVNSLSERINYDSKLFDLVSVNKASLISTNQWTLSSTPSVGSVDVSISSATAHFGPAGPLLTVRFRAHSDATVGQFSYLVQNNISFSNPLEPFAFTDAGKITISDICTPVRLVSGDLATSVEQNNPNPFNPVTHIHYAIGKNSGGNSVPVRLSLYDQLGRFVAALIDEPKMPGTYDYVFDGNAYSSGAYTYVFQGGDHIERKTMLLVK
jgi:hypothetical protein